MSKLLEDIDGFIFDNIVSLSMWLHRRYKWDCFSLSKICVALLSIISLSIFGFLGVAILILALIVLIVVNIVYHKMFSEKRIYFLTEAKEEELDKIGSRPEIKSLRRFVAAAQSLFAIIMFLLFISTAQLMPFLCCLMFLVSIILFYSWFCCGEVSKRLRLYINYTR